MIWLSAEEWGVVWLSLVVAFWSVLLSLPLALATAHTFARRRIPCQWILETMVDLPLVLPPVVTGYFLLVLFSPAGILGKLLDSVGFPIVFSWRGAVLASAIVSFPLMVRSIRLAIESIDPRIITTARTLGAGPWDTFWTITIPLSMGGIGSGILMAFARSLGEFGATIVVAAQIPGETITIPLAIARMTQVPGGVDRAMRLVLISVILAAATLLLSDWINRGSRRALA